MSRLPRGGKPSKTNVPLPSCSKVPPKQPEKPDPNKVPAFSVPLPKGDPVKQKKKTIARNKPAGENLAKLKQIMKSIRGRKVTVQEFIGLISPSTGDNGDYIRLALSDELKQFRISSRKIYETMTQDISDVLTNEHIQLTENSKERHQLLSDKMMRSINEIFTYSSDFDFDKYYTQTGYLADMFPLAEKIVMDEDGVAAMQRQEAYHRYQWLKTEGERMREENGRLQARLNFLKKQQRDHLKMVALREQQAEIEREQLEKTQEVLEDRLDDLNLSMEKSLVGAEVAGTSKVVKLKRKPAPKRELAKQKQHPTDHWAETTAAEMEAEAIANDMQRETSKVSVRAKSSRSKSRIQVKKVKAKPQPQETSPFHYSPTKSPTGEQQRSPFHYSPPPEAPPQQQRSPFHYSPPPEALPQQQRSPFHYSPPPEAPPQQQRSPFHYSPPPLSPQHAPQRAPQQPVEMTRVETTTEVVQPRFGRRGAAAPKDSWSGFN